MNRFVARIDHCRDGQPARHDVPQLNVFGDMLALLIAIKLDQSMTECGDFIVLRAAFSHRVDSDVQPEHRRKTAVNAALGFGTLTPLGNAQRHSTFWHRIALVILCGWCDGHKLARAEADVEQTQESVFHRLRQRHRLRGGTRPVRMHGLPPGMIRRCGGGARCSVSDAGLNRVTGAMSESGADRCSRLGLA